MTASLVSNPPVQLYPISSMKASVDEKKNKTRWEWNKQMFLKLELYAEFSLLVFRTKQILYKSNGQQGRKWCHTSCVWVVLLLLVYLLRWPSGGEQTPLDYNDNSRWNGSLSRTLTSWDPNFFWPCTFDLPQLLVISRTWMNIKNKHCLPTIVVVILRCSAKPTSSSEMILCVDPLSRIKIVKGISRWWQKQTAQQPNTSSPNFITVCLSSWLGRYSKNAPGWNAILLFCPLSAAQGDSQNSDWMCEDQKPRRIMPNPCTGINTTGADPGWRTVFVCACVSGLRHTAVCSEGSRPFWRKLL